MNKFKTDDKVIITARITELYMNGDVAIPVEFPDGKIIYFAERFISENPIATIKVRLLELINMQLSGRDANGVVIEELGKVLGLLEGGTE